MDAIGNPCSPLSASDVNTPLESGARSRVQPGSAKTPMSEIDTFITSLGRIQLPRVFNPYADTCPDHDKRGAPAIRRKNLRLVFEAGLAKGVETLWIGRDLGHRGGRRTGIALTDERHLSILERRLGIEGLTKATRTESMTERTAADVWQSVGRLKDVPIFWNAFPLHPHKAEESLSNRKHTRREFEVTEHFMSKLLLLFRPVRIIALGNDAHLVLTRLGQSSTLVRHPSYGGQAKFRLGIEAAYR